VRVITHGYTDVLPNDVPRIEGVEGKSSDDDNSFYPSYAAETLLFITYNLDKIEDERILLKAIENTHMLTVLLRAIKYAIVPTSYFCTALLGSLILKYPNLSVDEGAPWSRDAETRSTIINALLDLMALPLNTFTKELDSNRGSHAVDIVKRMQSLEVAKGYAPRFMNMMYERTAGTLSTFITGNIPNLQKEFLREPRLLNEVLQQLAKLPHESFPSASGKRSLSDMVSSLFHVDPLLRDFDQTKELFLEVETNNPNLLNKLLECYKLYRTTA
jgi:hypothetical protein